jgi:hypothetical protein
MSPLLQFPPPTAPPLAGQSCKKNEKIAFFSFYVTLQYIAPRSISRPAFGGFQCFQALDKKANAFLSSFSLSSI